MSDNFRKSKKRKIPTVPSLRWRHLKYLDDSEFESVLHVERKIFDNMVEHAQKKIREHYEGRKAGKGKPGKAGKFKMQDRVIMCIMKLILCDNIFSAKKKGCFDSSVSKFTLSLIFGISHPQFNRLVRPIEEQLFDSGYCKVERGMIV